MSSIRRVPAAVLDAALFLDQRSDPIVDAFAAMVRDAVLEKRRRRRRLRVVKGGKA